MAFKKPIDLSKPGQKQDFIRSPYEFDDRIYFRTQNLGPKRIHIVAATLDFADTRHEIEGKAIIGTVAHNGGTQRVLVKFLGTRADDLDENEKLQDEIKRIHTTNCDNQEFDLGIKIDMVIEGAYKPRKWTDSKGNNHTVFDLIVARARISLDGKVITIGALPVL